MKKIFVFVLMLVLVLSFSLVGSAYYEETNNYYDRVQQKADIVDTGNVLEYELAVSDQPARHVTEGIYFLNEDSYLEFSNVFGENDESLIDGMEIGFGYELYNKKGWTLSTVLSGRKGGTFNITLNTAKKVNDKFTLNNNLSVQLNEDFNRNLRTGLTYKLNDKNNFKFSIGRPTYSYVNNFSALFEDLCLRAGLETKVNEKYNNVIYIRNQFDNENIKIIEQIQYVGSDRFYLDTSFELNTNAHNQFEVETKTALNEDFYFTFDYYKVLAENGGYWAYPGIQYEF